MSPRDQEDVTLPDIKLRGKQVRVSFSLKRPRGKPGIERLRRAMEKIILRYGGKVSKKKPK
jgi:hypothetical protein